MKDIKSDVVNLKSSVVTLQSDAESLKEAQISTKKDIGDFKIEIKKLNLLQKDTAADLSGAKSEIVMLKRGCDQDVHRNMKKTLIFDGITFADTDVLSKIGTDTIKNKMKIEKILILIPYTI